MPLSPGGTMILHEIQADCGELQPIHADEVYHFINLSHWVSPFGFRNNSLQLFVNWAGKCLPRSSYIVPGFRNALSMVLVEERGEIHLFLGPSGQTKRHTLWQ